MALVQVCTQDPVEGLSLSLLVLPFLDNDFNVPRKCNRPFGRNFNSNNRVSGNSGREDGIRKFSFPQHFNSHLSSSILKVFLSIYILSM